MRRYFPFRKYRLEIPYSSSRFEEMMVDELARSRNRKNSFWSSSEINFKGRICNRNFEIERRCFGNSTMIPCVKGQICDSSDDKSAILELQIAFNIMTNLFLLIWFGFVAVVFLLSLVNALINMDFNIGIPVAIVMFLFAYGLMMVVFSEENKIIKRFFYEKWYIRLE
ncbi:MAG: hypothetical protein JXC36_06600 [Candidatus Atribacteria bacterium]|nr:hypothetical protein [Candidatus Atribacteria bacterium]